MKTLKKFFILITILLSLAVMALFYSAYQNYQLVKDYYPVHEVMEDIKEDVPNYITIDEVSKDFQNAIVAVEDHRFYERYGIDVIALGRAVVTNIVAQEFREGGSTITQQLIKNVYYDHHPSIIRKLAEFYFIYDFENIYSKDEILEMYMNIIYFGDGYYGVYDASIGYFNKEPKDLDLFESSLLAGLTNAPSIYQLSSGFDLALERQKHVLKRMYDNEYIDHDTYLNMLDLQSTYENPKKNASE